MIGMTSIIWVLHGFTPSPLLLLADLLGRPAKKGIVRLKKNSLEHVNTNAHRLFSEIEKIHA